MCAQGPFCRNERKRDAEKKGESRRETERLWRETERLWRDAEKDIGETRRKTERRGEGARCAVRVLRKLFHLPKSPTPFSFYSLVCRRLGLSRKNYAVRQHIECPSSASQHSECNEPAPHYPACLFDHKAGPARYVNHP